MATRASDLTAIIAKGIVGAIPIIGPLAAEVVGTIIPNQRIDRLENFLQRLDEKVGNADREKIRQKFTSAESVDLLEDGFYQAARALTDERKEYIASLIKNSLTDEQLKHIEYKKLLLILGQLNDVEVLILKLHALDQGNPESREFWEKHEEVLTPPVATNASTQEEIDKSAIFETYTNHLIDLGLLRRRFKKPKRGEFPEFDERTGMVKAQGHGITLLGRLLLRSIDQGGAF